ncbi:MAG: helix-turn-helix domain-containing protein [Pseudomonadota bacterium]
MPSRNEKEEAMNMREDVVLATRAPVHNPSDCLMTVPEVAAYLRYSLGYTRNLVWRNELPVIRLSTGAVRCRKQDLERWIAERSYAACSTH